MFAKSWIRNLFSSPVASPNKKNKTKTFQTLQLLTLEDRITPTTITVNTTADLVDPSPSITSLREAITLANTIPGNDTIDFNLTGSSPFTITLGSALPTILDANGAIAGGTVGTLTITGLGASDLTISGNGGNFSIFSIASGGDLTVSGVTVSGANHTSGNGGAFNNSGTLTLSNSTLSGNTADRGGGIRNIGFVTVSNSTLSANTANYAGAIDNDLGTVTVTNSTLSGNSANYAGGGINSLNGTVTVTNSNLSGNSAKYASGGINNVNGTLTVSNSTLSANTANSTTGVGGGITNNGTATVSNSTLSGNSAKSGGGIFNANGGTFTVSNSTLSGNSSNNGGGFFNDNGGSLTVFNSTFFGNSTIGVGGGIFNNFTGVSTVTNSTLSGNSANNGGGFYNRGTLNIANTIVAKSTGGGDFASIGTVNLIGSSTSANNLVTQNGLTWATTVTGDDIKLGPLQNNGGTTPTMALGATSVAIAAGDATISNASPVSGLDQRGFTRITSDIGAFAVSNLIQVTTTTDTVDADPNITSLREAITLANTTPGNDQISFNLTGTSPFTITLNSALPTILDANATAGASTVGTLTITGLGASSLTISGNSGNFSIFSIATGGNLNISGVTVSNGVLVSGNGGAFNNSGILNISNSTLSNNSSGSSGGGGAILNRTGATLNISNSTLSGNTGTGGGAIYNNGSISVANSTFLNNRATAGPGGAIFNRYSADLNISNSTFSGNSASKDLLVTPPNGNGGSIFNANNSTVTVTNSTFSDNSATNSGGAIFNTGAIVTVTSSTFSGNSANGTPSVITPNGGGAFYNNGTFTVSNSTLSGNSASLSNGGAILNYGTVNVSNSTLSGNSANHGGGLTNGKTGSLTVTNSTLSGNKATAGSGGAIYNNYGVVTLTNATISGNSAALFGGGIRSRTIETGSPNGSLSIANTIIANSTGGDYSSTGDTILVNTNNLCEDGSLAGAITGDPLLGPLQNNGGPTFTMALLSGSPAIGAGDATISNNPPINGLDQRGFIRNTSDIGPYSYNFANANDVVVSLDNSNQVVLALDSAGVTLSDVHTAYNSGANTLTITAATAGTLLTAPAGGIAGITIDNAATDNTVTLDLNTLVNFAGLVIVGNSGVDSVTIGAGGVDLSIVGGAFAATAATINLNGNVTTTSPQTYTGAVTLGISSGIFAAGSGDINFSGTVNSALTFKNNLTLNTTGTVNFIGAVGTDIGNLTISQSGGATFQSTVDADTVTISDTTGTIAFQGNLTLGIGLVTAAKGYNVSITGANNTIAGTTTFNNTGTVTLNDGKDGTLFPGGLVITAPSAITLQGTVSTTNTTMTLGDADTGITNNGTFGSPTILDAGTGSINLAGNVTGSGSNNPLKVITSGSGVTTISGVNSAEIQMSSGVVTIANPSDQTGGYRISGGTLRGGSMSKVGYIYAQSGTSLLSPGIDGPGMMHVNNALLLSSGNTVQIDLQGTTPETKYDQFVVCLGSNVHLNNATLALSPTFTPVAGTVFTIIDNQSGTAIDGTFNGLAEGATIVVNGSTYQISYVGGTGNDVTLTVLPPAPLVIGSAPPNGNDPNNPGNSVNLYDPVTGQPTGVAVPFPGFMGEIRVASGDFNNDGIAEIVAAAGPGGGPAIAILNSTTGAVMQAFFAYDPAFSGGVYVAVQDTNGDGVEDIVTGAGAGGGPHVKVFNGANLQELASFFAYAETFSGGVSVAAADINGDNILDIVTGAGPGGGPHVKVFDGASQTLISQWYAYSMDFTGGVFVAMGDLGNDENYDVITGAGSGGEPVVAVFNPFTGDMQSQFLAYAQEFSGGVRVGISEATGDGIPDLITGAGPGGSPHVKVFSYPGLVLFEFFSGPVDNTEGVFVS